MLGIALRDAGRSISSRVFGISESFSFLDASLESAHAGQILIELVAVTCVQTLLHLMGILEYKIKDRAFLLPSQLQVFSPVARSAFAEQTFEDKAWVGLRSHGCGWRTPGDI